MTAFLFDGHHIQPGEKFKNIVRIENYPYEIPYVVINGSADGPVLMLTAGVHNQEFIGIQSAVELAREFDPDHINGTVLIFPMVNRSGFEHRTMSYTYEDGKNFNRVFPGDPEGSISEIYAHWFVHDVFPLVDYCVDMHSGDNFEELTPYVYCQGNAAPEVMEKSLDMARDVNVPYIVVSNEYTHGLYNQAGTEGIPGILIERGNLSQRNTEDSTMMKNDVYNIMVGLGMLRHRKHAASTDGIVLSDCIYQMSPQRGLWYPRWNKGTYVTKGSLIGEIHNYFGEVIYTCRAETDGVILYQTKSLNILEDDVMACIGVIDR